MRGRSSTSYAQIFMNITQIRKSIRQQRRSLSKFNQFQHQIAVKKHLLRSGLLKKYKRIGIYLHSDGELATDLIIKQLHNMRRQVFLPVLHPSSTNRLVFLSYKRATPLIKNRFGIFEPALIIKHIPVTSLDIIFMPLVAFDENGNRIGMGGGFYDRTLSASNIQPINKRPLLIGLAHELQNINEIKKRSWDIPLDAVITEKKVRKFTKAFI